ncbi:hypothetical protein QFC22_004570 [Naganishia vaughanmartiniae]|uniref:Uncharacterized protein n=1 Tax=Naganishia vaughanmartiniae TaxID=1424756 RepID=A0ACC2WZM2_9TREE|nr:hypothetical protein QFC22_004570 [Naganishia vaughanmartiniae]
MPSTAPGHPSYPPPTDPLRYQTSQAPQQPPMSGYTTSPPPHQNAYPPVSPPPARQSFAQVGQVMHDQNQTQQMGGYPPSFPQHAPTPPPLQHHGLHHSHSQPLYDPTSVYGGPGLMPINTNLTGNGNGSPMVGFAGQQQGYDQQWAQGPPITTQQPAGAEMYMPDPRMMSPPPFLPHQSSDHYLYSVDGQVNPYNDPVMPGRAYSPYPGSGAGGNGNGNGNGMPGAYTPMNDDADQPLLSRHQSAGDGHHGRYGNPFMASTGDLGAAGADDLGIGGADGQAGGGGGGGEGGSLVVA